MRAGGLCLLPWGPLRCAFRGMRASSGSLPTSPQAFLGQAPPWGGQKCGLCL